MKLGLGFIEQVRAQSSWAAKTFSDLTALISTAYHAEHNDDDTHKIIHASGAVYERNRTVAMGDFVSPAFDAAVFSASGSMTWTVTSTTRIAFSYWKLGSTLFVNYWVSGSVLSGTAATSLRIRLPEHLGANGFASAPMHYVNGAAGCGAALVSTGDRYISLVTATSANWDLANTVSVRGQLALPVIDVSGDAATTETAPVLDPILTYTGGTVNFATSSTLPLSTAGTYTITVNRLLTVSIDLGAGGGGGAGDTTGSTAGGGGGGGGGVSRGTVVQLAPAKTYTLIIGAGGAGATGGGAAGGGSSFVNTTDTVNHVVLGGGGGGNPTGGTGGTAGTATTGTGLVAGGAGGNGGGAGASGNVGACNANGAGGGGSGAGRTSHAGAGGAGGGSTGTTPAPGVGGASGDGIAANAVAGATGTGGATGGGVQASIEGGGGGGGGASAIIGSLNGGGGGGGVGASGSGTPTLTGGNGDGGSSVFTFVSAP